MKREKKMNSYLKLTLIFITAVLIGSALGDVMVGIENGIHNGIALDTGMIVKRIQSIQFQIQGVIFAVTIILAETFMQKLRIVCEKELIAIDEERNRLECEEEKVGAMGANTIVFSQVLGIFFLSFGFPKEFVDGDFRVVLIFLFASIVFCACMIYDAFWQVRWIKFIQKIHPEKKGDPTSLKFREQWMESCNEVEREIIYKSIYKTYMTIIRIIPIVLMCTVIGNWYYDTGMFAVFVVVVIWMLTNFIYARNCVKVRASYYIKREPHENIHEEYKK